MIKKTWQLPWQGEMVPHAVLDVLRGCNIRCRRCFNIDQPLTPKPLKQIEEELDTLLRLRRLSSVTILGGEVTLHPQLEDIVRLVKGRGLHSELFTNGLDIDPSACRRLKDAGLSIICFHIEKGQQRADLADSSSAEEVARLRYKKTIMASQAGLDVGLSVTSFPGERDALRDVISFVLKTPEISYVLVTLFRDHSNIKSLSGNLHSGFSGTGAPPDPATKQSNRDIADWMKAEFNVEPFACMGSNLDMDDPRWLSYLIGALHNTDGTSSFDYLQPSLLEKAMMLAYRVRGRYPMYMEPNTERFRKQLVLNGFLGGRRQPNMTLAKRSKEPGVQLKAKRLLFQNPAEMTEDGKMLHCKWCPDTVLKNGGLVPVCIADHVTG
jgi:pyruvate-formate lyase-activating enzyme